MNYKQVAFDGAFMLSATLGMHILMIWLRDGNFEIARFGTMFNLVRVRATSSREHGSAESPAAPVFNERRSTLLSAFVIFVTLALSATLIAVVVNGRLTGVQLGVFLVWSQSFGMGIALVDRFRPQWRGSKAAYALLAVGGLCAYAWVIFDNWMASDFAALVICAYALHRFVKPVPMLHLVGISAAIVLYDLWGVWGSPSVGGGAIAVGVGALVRTRLPPLGIISPQLPLSVHSDWSSMLGLGDIMFPAFVTLTAAAHKLHRWALGAYGVGLVVAAVIMYNVAGGVPALVPILPIMILTLLIVGKIKGVKFQ